MCREENSLLTERSRWLMMGEELDSGPSSHLLYLNLKDQIGTVAHHIGHGDIQ